MEKLRGFNLVYLATAQRNASRDSVPAMKCGGVQAEVPLPPQHALVDSRWPANQRIFCAWMAGGINGDGCGRA